MRTVKEPTYKKYITKELKRFDDRNTAFRRSDPRQDIEPLEPLLKFPPFYVGLRQTSEPGPDLPKSSIPPQEINVDNQARFR